MTAVESVIGDERAKTNGPETPDQDVFIAWVKECISADAVVAQARAARQKVRKQAKAAGIELGAMDAAIKLSDWEPGEIREHFRVQHQYAVWMSLPVGSQLDLLEGVPDAARPEIDWRAKGFIAATTGRGTFGTPPDDCPGDQIQNWMGGWTKGQSFNAPSPLKPDPEPDAPPLVADEQTDIEEFGPTDEETFEEPDVQESADEAPTLYVTEA